MADAVQKLETVAEEAKEVADAVAATGLWKRYKALRVAVYAVALSAMAGAFVYGYLHEANGATAAPLETQTHADAEHERLDKKIDAVASSLPDAVAKKVVEALRGNK